MAQHFQDENENENIKTCLNRQSWVSHTQERDHKKAWQHDSKNSLC
jgi:hypothetical protein